jgi:hypothetical protein
MRLAVFVFASLVLAGVAAANQGLDLPSSRPPLWPFRSYKDTKSWSCSINGNNVLFLNGEAQGAPQTAPSVDQLAGA